MNIFRSGSRTSWKNPSSRSQKTMWTCFAWCSSCGDVRAQKEINDNAASKESKAREVAFGWRSRDSNESLEVTCGSREFCERADPKVNFSFSPSPEGEGLSSDGAVSSGVPLTSSGMPFGALASTNSVFRQKRRPTVSLGRNPTVKSPQTSLIAVSDPGQDLDDEMSFIMMRYLVDQGLIALGGIVATLAPSHDRARLCRGTLNLLGLKRVPVGVGSDGGDSKGRHTAKPFEVGARSYMPTQNSEEAMLLEPGRRLLGRIYADAEPCSLTLLIIASTKDAALFIRDNEELFAEKTREVVVMGGMELPEGHSELLHTGGTLPPGVYMKPDTSHNLEFDKLASDFLFRRCQELGVPLVLVSRWTAYAVPMPRDTYDKLAISGSSIGRRLRNAQRDSLEQLWKRATAAADDPARNGLPIRCDRKWFMSTFCSGQDDGRGGDQPVWDLVTSFNQYDTIALLATVPSLRDEYFEPLVIEVESQSGETVEHLIIGVSKNEPNLVTPTSNLVEFLHTGFEMGLSLDHHFKAQIVLIAELRSDTITDLMMMGVMLRTLYELETLHCLGIVFVPSHGPSGEISPRHSAQFDKFRELLDLAGLRFVPVFQANSAADATRNVKELYLQSLPTGVTLVISASLKSAAAFVDEEPEMFCEKTARVVLMGGTKRAEDAAQWLVPDPDAQNNRLDLDAANRFYKKAQELSVTLVVLSRFAARAGSVPRAVCDILASHGGPIGKHLCETQRDCLLDLWHKCSEPAGSPDRGGVPARCDRQWFLNSFCDRKTLGEDDDIWNSISSFNAYSPLTLLFALPGVVKHFVRATPVHIRAATHQVIGWSAEDTCVPSPLALQKLLVHSLVYGSRCNVSEYDLGEVPTITLGFQDDFTDFKFNMSEEALDELVPARAAVDEMF